MKKLFLLTILLIPLVTIGQSNSISFSYGIGINRMLQDNTYKISQYDGEIANSLELKYSRFFGRNNRRNSTRWGMEIGANYSAHEYWSIASDTTYLERSNIIFLNIYSKVQFREHWYFSFGPIFTSDLNYSDNYRRSKQNGIGLGAEFGGNYKLSRKWGLIMAIFARQHNLFPLQKSTSYEAMFEAGLKVGFEFKF